jgi:hypothetical protein
MENEIGKPVPGDVRRQTGVIFIVKFEDGTRLRAIRAADHVSGWDPTISADGKMLASSSTNDSTILIWDVASLIQGPRPSASPDGRAAP